jgi:hypothetical protein
MELGQGHTFSWIEPARWAKISDLKKSQKISGLNFIFFLHGDYSQPACSLLDIFSISKLKLAEHFH